MAMERTSAYMSDDCVAAVESYHEKRGEAEDSGAGVSGQEERSSGEKSTTSDDMVSYKECLPDDDTCFGVVSEACSTPFFSLTNVTGIGRATSSTPFQK